MTVVPSAAPALSPKLNLQLSVMMFLQYAIWGAWLPLMFPFFNEHRHISPSTIGYLAAIGALGALISPFIAGQIADRYFNTEKFLGVSHLVGAVLEVPVVAHEPGPPGRRCHHLALPSPTPHTLAEGKRR